MIIRIDMQSHIPIYEQIRDQIVLGIAVKALVPDEILPSVRRLAADLGVHFHTVNKAYALLRDEGYVKVYGRKGAVVAKPPVADEAFIKEMESTLLKLMAEAKSKGMEPAEVVRLAENLSKTEEFRKKKGEWE